MGTCGLVGPIGIYTAMGGSSGSMWLESLMIVCFVLPAVLTFIFGGLRKMGWTKKGCGWTFKSRNHCRLAGINRQWKTGTHWMVDSVFLSIYVIFYHLLPGNYSLQADL